MAGRAGTSNFEFPAGESELPRVADGLSRDVVECVPADGAHRDCAPYRASASMRKEPEAEEAGDENGDASGIVPGSNGPDAFGGGDPCKQQGAANVEDERQGEARQNAEHTAPGAEPVEFAEEQGNHQGGLEGTDAAARVVNAHHSVPISMTLPCWMAGIPMAASSSMVAPTFARVRSWMRGPSTNVGHGTATRKKQTGKTKAEKLKAES